MQTLVAAIHGILTNQTDPSWPDKLDAWLLAHDPEVKVLKKKYFAAPFPHWNCLVKDPYLARSLANELELFIQDSITPSLQHSISPPLDTRHSTLDTPPVWLVAHSNGAVIALLAAKILIARGHRIAGLILIGAAIEADIHKTPIFEWYCQLQLGAAIAYSSPDDEVLDGDPRVEKPLRVTARAILDCFTGNGWQAALALAWPIARDWLWGKLMWPYGCLGRTGWLCGGRPLDPQNPNPQPSTINHILTRWYPGGHSTYFTPENIEVTFEQIYHDITASSHQSTNPLIQPSIPKALPSGCQTPQSVLVSLPSSQNSPIPAA
jgi:hypothetical protein